jgi:hypothetical protein
VIIFFVVEINPQVFNFGLYQEATSAGEENTTKLKVKTGSPECKT